MSASVWKTLSRCPAAELRPGHTMLNGQCFGWRPHESREGEFVGVLGRRVVAIRETSAATQFRALHGGADGLEAELRDYFQLGTVLAPLYAAWGGAGCERMGIIVGALDGLRILRQEPSECLVSFICSSNNNVPRITLILDRMRERYGERLCPKAGLEGDTPAKPAAAATRAAASAAATAKPAAAAASPSPARNKLMPRMEVSADWHAFPAIEQLAAAPEADLRELGLGYRAKVRFTKDPCCEFLNLSLRLVLIVQ